MKPKSWARDSIPIFPALSSNVVVLAMYIRYGAMLATNNTNDIYVNTQVKTHTIDHVSLVILNEY